MKLHPCCVTAAAVLGKEVLPFCSGGVIQRVRLGAKSDGRSLGYGPSVFPSQSLDVHC